MRNNILKFERVFSHFDATPFRCLLSQLTLLTTPTPNMATSAGQISHVIFDLDGLLLGMLITDILQLLSCYKICSLQLLLE